MTHTRWKLLAGCFGIAMCGLAALAGASRQSPLAMGCDYRPLVTDEPRQVAAVIPVQPLLTKAVERKLDEAATKPPVVLVPTLPSASIEVTPRMESLKLAGQTPLPVTSPSPVQTPPAPSLPQSAPAIAMLPTVAGSIDLPSLPVNGSNPDLTAAPKMAIPEPIQLPTLATPTTPPNPPLTIVPESAITLPGIAPSGSQAPVAPKSPIVPARPIDPILSGGGPGLIPEPHSTPSIAIPGIEKKPDAPAAPATPEVTLTIRMTGGSPAVELRSTSGAYLTITCEQLDIAARSTKDELPSSIKASGKVKFTASGCQGTCDELVFSPKSMDGTLRNAVKVLCTYGGTSTEFTADQIAFQLLTESTKSVVSFQAQGSGMIKK